MISVFGITTALPNLHPAVVHFPVALILTALAMRTVYLLRPGWRRADQLATLLTVFAALGGGAAWLFGKQAVSKLGPMATVAEQTLSRHADGATWTVVALFVAAIVSLLVARSGEERKNIFSLRFTMFLAVAMASAVMSVTADLGGRLVFEHGVGVATTEQRDVDAPPSADTITRSDFGQGGISIVVDGEGMLTLPDVHDDVSVSAIVDLSEFDGSLALAHHVLSLEDWEGLVLGPANRVALIRMKSGKEDVLKSTSLLFPRRQTRLDVTAASGHFKGFVDGDMVVHGHGDSAPPGKVGLYYSGRGVLKVELLTTKDSEAAHSAD